MRKLLSIAMAKHIGQTITVDTASAILREVFADYSYTPDKFEVREYRGFTFQCETMADVLPELHRLHELHYEETEGYLTGIPMDPDYEGMKDRERAGGLIQFTARESATGALVGNMRVYINASMHNRELFCTEDTFFLLKEHRGGFLAVRLWQYVEDAVREIVGVRGVAFDSKTANNADKMALYLKYTPVATRFVKLFN